MGFKLSSFLAGATRGAVEVLEEDQARAEKSAAFGVKSMKENYDKVMAENRKLESEVSENIKFLQTYDKTATQAEIFAAATNSAFMSMAVDAAKTNPAGFKLNKFIKIKEENASPLTAMERLKEHTSLMAAEKAAPEETKSSGNIISDLRGRVSDKAARKAEEQTAKAMGVSIEQLRAASGYKRPEIDAGAEFNMAGFQKPKSFTEQEEQAKSALLDAQRTNDPEKIKLAQADLLIVNNIKQSLTPAQTQFANKVADIKNRYMFGTPEERKAAKPEYDKLMGDIRAEAMAKKVTKEEDEKIPALSTLNTFTSAAVVRAVAAKHGDLIKTKQLAIVEKADGSVGIDYIGDDEAKRRQILETQANAAKNALSLYTDAQGKPFNRDVASVLNSFTSIVPSVVRNDTPSAAPAAGGPQAAAKPAAATPAPKTKAEYDAIPKGTQYIDTDGKTKIKG